MFQLTPPVSNDLKGRRVRPSALLLYDCPNLQLDMRAEGTIVSTSRDKRTFRIKWDKHKVPMNLEPRFIKLKLSDPPAEKPPATRTISRQALKTLTRIAEDIANTAKDTVQRRNGRRILEILEKEGLIPAVAPYTGK